MLDLDYFRHLVGNGELGEEEVRHLRDEMYALANIALDLFETRSHQLAEHRNVQLLRFADDHEEEDLRNVS